MPARNKINWKLAESSHELASTAPQIATAARNGRSVDTQDIENLIAHFVDTMKHLGVSEQRLQARIRDTYGPAVQPQPEKPVTPPAAPPQPTKSGFLNR